MKAVVDRIVQYANRYQLTNVETGEVLGTFDFDEVTGTVQQVGTEIDKELFDSIANDLAARVKLSGGELANTIVTFSDIPDTAANVASGEKSSVLWGKVKNWFSRLKALAFKNKVAAGDFEAGAIKNADVAADAAIAQSKVSGLMTDYVASIGVSGRTLTFKNKNGVNMGSITTQDTTYGLASQSSNGLMSSTDKTKLDGIESGAQKNTVLGVKGGSESAYRTGNVNITKANIGLGNVDNTSDKDKPVSTATQTALNGKANTSGSYPNLTVGKATADADGNVIPDTYALLPTSVTDTDRASGQWVVGTGGTPASGKTMLLGMFNIYDTNIWLHISGGFARGGSSNYTTDANVFISSLQGAVNEAYCYVRKLYKSSRTQGIYYTLDSSKNLRIYAAVPQYGKLFVSAEVSGGSIVGKGSSEDAYPSGGRYIPEKNYADLSQVVRKDVLVGAINPTSDAGKNWLANKQVMTSGAIISASGWYRIALIPNYCKIKLNIFKQYNYDVGTATTITINSGIANRNYVLINVENSLTGDSSDNYVKQVRFSDISTNTSGYVDVYIEAGENETNAYWLAVDVEKVYNTNFEIYAFESVTEAVADNAIIVDVPQSGGSNTNKPIYQQGSPVLVGDQSAIFESNGTTVKNATKATNADNAVKVNGKNLYMHSMALTISGNTFYTNLLTPDSVEYTTDTVKNAISTYYKGLVAASGCSFSETGYVIYNRLMCVGDFFIVYGMQYGYLSGRGSQYNQFDPTVVTDYVTQIL